MRLLIVLPALFLLLATPVVSRIAGYNPDDNLRPDNVTGLDYKYYNKIGSYYNGTLEISISPKYNPTPGIFRGKTCHEFENKTVKISMKAISGFQEVAPKAPSPNPFFLNLNAWDKDYNLTNQYQTANYSEYDAIRISTNTDQDFNASYHFNITNNNTETWYDFHGLANPSVLRWENFKFNVSGYCDPNKGSDESRLFTGNLLSPDERIQYDWTENPIPVPTIRGGFTEHQAWVEVSGLFEARSRDTDLVGEIRFRFDGLVDSDRSDQLFMGRKTPEWNATMGFAVGSVGGAGESAASAFSPLKLSGFTLVTLATMVMIA
ncbi:hypothetical protein BDV29DRAFT_155847 [Aspergillus leporis]|uniref:Concanavalin A-like lectin/glucanase domain-containing protein n=1 Tax=Aspergillus leporis TaxID=41062 RepID=A0A5N5X569_9EURO|nr:hypothetical protein BDV29DRAFT_155847 [Aspergillus leporis]